MSDHRANRVRPPKRGYLWSRLASRSHAGGQALIEYALILVLVVIAVIAVFALTGPAVGNIFSNQVYNLLGGTIEPRATLEENAFWTQVAAVASYTPENPSLVTNTPAPPTNVPTLGPSLTPAPTVSTNTPSPVPTAGPSPTPKDTAFGYPSGDLTSDPDWWKTGLTGSGASPLDGATWNAEFWNYNRWSDGGSSRTYTYNNYPVSLTNPDGSGKCTQTYSSLNISDGSQPCSGLYYTNRFYTRAKTTVTLESKPYTLSIMATEGVRVWVGGVLVVGADAPNAGDPDTWITTGSSVQTISRTFTPASAGSYEVVVEHFNSNNSNTAVLIVDMLDAKPNFDVGNCHWALSSDPEPNHTPPDAWSDSPGRNYEANSYCILSLRGYVSLASASKARLEFWDRYVLGANAVARVGVSEAGTENWVYYDLHQNSETNFSWSRYVFDLSDFAGTNFLTTPTKLVAIRFVLDARSASTDLKDGWWIDDIKVQEEYIPKYSVGFSDDMESASTHWYAGGTWARSNESAHSGSYAWTDSPGKDYDPSTDSTLELDGLVDLTSSPANPELVFWHRYELAQSDSIYIEYSEDHVNWTSLLGGSTPLATAETNYSWTQRVISLDSLNGRSFFVRFRLDAANDSNVADGWWIDDFSLRTRPLDEVAPNWCDNLEVDGSQWEPEGTWGLINGTDFNPSIGRTVRPRNGSQFWSDSPRANYMDSTNSALQLRPILNLTTSTQPELVFWHLWDVAAYDKLYVDVSQDGGTTWNSVWSYVYNQATPPASGSTSRMNGYNTILSWTREVVDLSSFAGSNIRVRFRLDATTNSAVADGWWLDDICFQEHEDLMLSLPFSDDFEHSDANWYAGGTWGLTNDSIITQGARSGTMITDSPTGNYEHQTNAILELKGILNLPATSKPTLYYWDVYDIASDDVALVEINTSSDRVHWSGWTEVDYHRYETVNTWDRHQINLDSYAGQYVRLRFRLYAVTNTPVGKGWWIDDVAVSDRNSEHAHTLPFYDDLESANAWWVLDGTWDKVVTLRPIGSGSGLGPGGWTAEYYSDLNKNHNFDAGELAVTKIDSDINFDWGNGSPEPRPLPSSYMTQDSCVFYGDCFPYRDPADCAADDSACRDNYFMVRWTRNITVPTGGYEINTRTDDGVRVMITPLSPPGAQTTIIDHWTNQSPTDYTATIPPGQYTIVVEYYENTGGAVAQANFTALGNTFHDSPGTSVNSIDLGNSSLTLEDPINLAGSTYPTLTYWEKYELGPDDNLYVEVSTDGGQTWGSPLRTVSGGTDLIWRKVMLNLSSYAGQRINIRFRLDTRGVSTLTGDGWYIDDIVVAE